MGKDFVDYVNLYGKIMALDKKLADSSKIEIKLHLLNLYEKIDKLKEKLDVLEKKFEKSND